MRDIHVAVGDWSLPWLSSAVVPALGATRGRHSSALHPDTALKGEGLAVPASACAGSCAQPVAWSQTVGLALAGLRKGCIRLVGHAETRSTQKTCTASKLVSRAAAPQLRIDDLQATCWATLPARFLLRNASMPPAVRAATKMMTASATAPLPPALSPDPPPPMVPPAAQAAHAGLLPHA